MKKYILVLASLLLASSVSADPIQGHGGGGGVPTTRTVSTSSPLGGGGALSGDLTLTCATCVVGPASSADNGVPRYDSTTGKLLQTSGLVITDADILELPTSASQRLYNTADKVTNSEYLSSSFIANVATIRTNATGSGSTRHLVLGAGTISTLNLGGSGSGATVLTGSTGTGNLSLFTIQNGVNWGSSTGTQNGLAILGTVNQSSTGTWNGIFVNSTMVTTGSGGASFLRLQSDSTDRFRVDVSGKMAMDSTMTAAATTGAQTIHKPSGSVNFAAAATSLVVTNNLVTTASIITPVMMTADATCRIASVVPGSGSFTINMTAGCGAETRVGFVVHN